MINYYEVLDINVDADNETIQKAIRDKRRLWNTRTNLPDDQKRREAEEMVSVIASAERILLDASKREQYNNELSNESDHSFQTEYHQGQSSGNGQNWLAVCEHYYKSGDYGSLLYAAGEAVNQQPDHPTAWYFKAYAEFKNNMLPISDFSFSEAIRLSPDKSPALFLDDYGEMCLLNNNPKKAMRCFVMAKQNEPDYYEADDFVLKRCRCLHLMEAYEVAAPLLTEYYNKHGGREAIANYYASFIVDMIYNAWSTTHEGYKTITNLKQLCFSKEWLSVLRSIIVTNNDLKGSIGTLRNLVMEAEKVTTATGDGIGGLLEYGLLVGTLNAINQKPNWQWTRDSLTLEEVRTGLQ